MSYPDDRKFKVRACGSVDPVGVLRQSYGKNVYGSGLKEGDMVAACKCCPEVRYLSATLEWIGYEKFSCEGDAPIDPADKTRSKYLTYTTSGEAQISDCSGSTNHRAINATQSWTIDPFTGLTNYSGPGTQNVSYLCSGGTETCAPTQKQKTCTVQTAGDPCNPSPTGERQVSFTETLSWQYNLSHVAGKIDEAVGRLDLYSESQGIPDGTVGFVENGTGHSIVRLSPSKNAYSSCPAVGCADRLDALWVETFNPTTRQWFVTKQYIYIKFKKNTEYKVYREDLKTGEVKESKKTDSGEVIIKANKVDEKVWVTVDSHNEFYGCGDGYKCVCYTMAGCEDTGQKSYKQSTETCTPLIGPDCQQYFQSMHTVMASGSDSGSRACVDYLTGSHSYKYELTSATKTTACPLSSVENTSETETGQVTGWTPGPPGETVTTPHSYSKTVTNNSTTVNGFIAGEYGGFGAGACGCQKSISTDVIGGEACAPMNVKLGTATSNCTTTIAAASITTSSSYNYQTSWSGTFGNRPSSASRNVSASSTSTTVWTNPGAEDAGGLETVYDETNYTNSAWFETGFNNSGRYFVSTADVKKKCTVKFTACQTNQSIAPFDKAIDYVVLLHCVKRTFDQKDPQNPILTWEVDNQRKTVKSKGGPEEADFDIEIPTPATDKTVSALAYSTCTVWKKPN